MDDTLKRLPLGHTHDGLSDDSASPLGQEPSDAETLEWSDSDTYSGEESDHATEDHEDSKSEGEDVYNDGEELNNEREDLDNEREYFDNEREDFDNDGEDGGNTDNEVLDDVQQTSGDITCAPIFRKELYALNTSQEKIETGCDEACHLNSVNDARHQQRAKPQYVDVDNNRLTVIYPSEPLSDQGKLPMIPMIQHIVSNHKLQHSPSSSIQSVTPSATLVQHTPMSSVQSVTRVAKFVQHTSTKSIKSVTPAAKVLKHTPTRSIQSVTPAAKVLKQTPTRSMQSVTPAAKVVQHTPTCSIQEVFNRMKFSGASAPPKLHVQSTNNLRRQSPTKKKLDTDQAAGNNDPVCDQARSTLHQCSSVGGSSAVVARPMLQVYQHDDDNGNTPRCSSGQAYRRISTQTQSPVLMKKSQSPLCLTPTSKKKSQSPSCVMPLSMKKSQSPLNPAATSMKNSQSHLCDTPTSHKNVPGSRGEKIWGKVSARSTLSKQRSMADSSSDFPECGENSKVRPSSRMPNRWEEKHLKGVDVSPAETRTGVCTTRMEENGAPDDYMCQMKVVPEPLEISSMSSIHSDSYDTREQSRSSARKRFEPQDTLIEEPLTVAGHCSGDTVAEPILQKCAKTVRETGKQRLPISGESTWTATKRSPTVIRLSRKVAMNNQMVGDNSLFVETTDDAFEISDGESDAEQSDQNDPCARVVDSPLHPKQAKLIQDSCSPDIHPHSATHKSANTTEAHVLRQHKSLKGSHRESATPFKGTSSPTQLVVKCTKVSRHGEAARTKRNVDATRRLCTLNLPPLSPQRSESTADHDTIPPLTSQRCMTPKRTRLGTKCDTTSTSNTALYMSPKHTRLGTDCDDNPPSKHSLPLTPRRTRLGRKDREVTPPSTHRQPLTPKRTHTRFVREAAHDSDSSDGFQSLQMKIVERKRRRTRLQKSSKSVNRTRLSENGAGEVGWIEISSDDEASNNTRRGKCERRAEKSLNHEAPNDTSRGKRDRTDTLNRSSICLGNGQCSKSFCFQCLR